jgi:hypothetical protein
MEHPALRNEKEMHGVDGPQLHMLAFKLNSPAHLHTGIPSAHVRGAAVGPPCGQIGAQALDVGSGLRRKLVALAPGVKLLIRKPRHGSRVLSRVSRARTETAHRITGVLLLKASIPEFGAKDKNSPHILWGRTGLSGGSNRRKIIRRERSKTRQTTHMLCDQAQLLCIARIVVPKGPDMVERLRFVQVPPKVLLFQHTGMAWLGTTERPVTARSPA